MFRRLITFDEAKRAVSEQIKYEFRSGDEIALLDAYDRVLRKNVVSELDVPPFDRSTVDGYSVKAEDTSGAEENQPVKLFIRGMVSVGKPPRISVGKGEAAEIVTGAPIPEGADAVVKVEDTHKKDTELEVFRAVTLYENVMKRGTDIKRGETVLKAGQVLGASEIGVLAALGLTQVRVFKVPTVAVLSTGAEVTEPGQELADGKIYDINAYSLSTAVRESGGTPIYFGVVPDDKAELHKALKRALASSDMVLISGGVSVGPKDLTPQVVDSLGEPGVIISGIAVKPGKPTTIALVGKKPVFALPGHPTSALLLFNLLARPVIQSMSGRSVTELKTVKASAITRMFTTKGRRTFVMVRLKCDKANRLVIEPVEAGASGAITTLAKADGFVEIPANQQFIDAGEEVVVSLLKSAW